VEELAAAQEHLAALEAGDTELGREIEDTETALEQLQAGQTDLRGAEWIEAVREAANELERLRDVQDSPEGQANYQEQLAEAHDRVADAQERLTETTFSLEDAQERLNEATDPDRQRELERAVTLAERALESQKMQVSDLRDELQTSPTMDDYADEIANAEAELQRLEDKQREYGNTAREEFNRAIQNAGNYRNSLDMLHDHPIWNGDFRLPGAAAPGGGAQMTPAGGAQTIPSGGGNNITMYNPIFQGVGDTDNFFSQLEDMQP
jgi:chromosome segregation ATPase